MGAHSAGNNNDVTNYAAAFAKKNSNAALKINY